MSRATRFAALALVGAAACGNNTTVMDMATNTNKDMTVTTPPDMTFVPPTFAVPSGCTPTTGVTASMFYANIITANCAVSGCHVAGATPPNYAGGAASFIANVKNVSAGRAAVQAMQYIKPNDYNNSFLLYKIAGQQDKVPSGGTQMPQGRAPLSAADQCTLISWVNSGAN